MSQQSLNASVSRRRMLQFGAGAVGSTVVAAALGQEVISTPPAIAQNTMTPDEALKQLMAGNQRFTASKRKYGNQDAIRLNEVAKGQKPFAAILGCADSRVPSEIVFDQGLGDLFVCRVAGNIAVTEEIGSLEFGAAVLGTKIIMVMGHERCGAVDAALKGTPVPGQIGSLLDAIKPSLASVKNQPGDALENACKSNIVYQIEKLKASPVLADLITKGNLKIVGGYYDLDTGKVSLVS
jgi:carbonic anhydrase